MLRLSDFNYSLPKELIAQYPLKKRDEARLLVVNRKENNLEHRLFKDIVEYLLPEDLLVFNDTKVLSCRLNGTRLTGGKVELFLLKHRGGAVFNALIKPGRLKINEKINFNGADIQAEILSKSEVIFNTQDINKIYNLGNMPLPPYIKREAEDSDKIDYQTVYARKPGAVASPTAGLHFTKELLKEIKSLGINIAYVTLHVGLGTFKPVKSEDVIAHKMETESFEITRKAVKALIESRRRKGRVFAVGTTSLRVLESYALGKAGETDLFIYPGFKFRVVDKLLTNFHLPRTTLFILVRAFGGAKLITKAYREAVDKKYRFYSYGDAMLIL